MPPDYRKHFNEPALRRPADAVPRFGPVPPRLLEPAVRARLELERAFEAGEIAPGIRWTPSHRKVLLAMLDEVDSPRAARLRAQAARWAGRLKLAAAIPRLRRIAVDPAEDVATRAAAIRSYIELDSRGATRALPSILNAPEATVRGVAYGAALRSKDPKLRRAARQRFDRETSPAVRSMVARRSGVVRRAVTTRPISR